MSSRSAAVQVQISCDVARFGIDFHCNMQCLLQVIDLGQSSLQNVITFENGASFVIDSSLEISSEKRLTFKFSGARLNLPSRTWKLPPFGKGW